MHRFKRIMVYIDTNRISSSMLQQAVQLASQNGAQLTFTSCYEVPLPISGEPAFSDRSALSEENIREEKYRLLESLAKPYLATFPGLKMKLIAGRKSHNLNQYILKEQQDLLMLAVDSQHVRIHRGFSDLTLQLVKKCPCPVWVFSSGKKRESHRILAAVDAGADSEAGMSANRQILDLAVSLAERKYAELHIINCWESHRESHLHIPADQKEDYLVQQKMHHQKRFQELIRSCSTATVRIIPHMFRGDPSFHIPAFASEHSIDLLVIGAVGQKGLRELILGNTAEKILHKVSCSILAIKPDGFICPDQSQ